MMTKGSEDEARSECQEYDMFGVCHPQPYHGNVEQTLYVMNKCMSLTAYSLLACTSMKTPAVNM